LRSGLRHAPTSTVLRLCFARAVPVWGALCPPPARDPAQAASALASPTKPRLTSHRVRSFVDRSIHKRGGLESPVRVRAFRREERGCGEKRGPAPPPGSMFDVAGMPQERRGLRERPRVRTRRAARPRCHREHSELRSSPHRSARLHHRRRPWLVGGVRGHPGATRRAFERLDSSRGREFGPDARLQNQNVIWRSTRRLFRTLTCS